TSDGMVRTFDSSGRMTKMRRLSHSFTLSYNCAGGRLCSVTSGIVGNPPTQLIDFDYYTTGPNSGRLWHVTSHSTPTIRATYTYNTCGELSRVDYPAVKLGYDKAGDAIPGAFTPAVSYVYENLDASFCTQTNGAGYHLLTQISHDQNNPLTGE